MKITKRQLKKIIREEKSKLLTEGYYTHELFAEAAAALNERNPGKLEEVVSTFRSLMMDESESASYTAALEAMLEAAYELEQYEQEY